MSITSLNVSECLNTIPISYTNIKYPQQQIQFPVYNMIQITNPQQQQRTSSSNSPNPSSSVSPISSYSSSSITNTTTAIIKKQLIDKYSTISSQKNMDLNGSMDDEVSFFFKRYFCFDAVVYDGLRIILIQ
jgi:hypothetical protein